MEEQQLLLAQTGQTPPSGALISPCGEYRYRLWRVWDRTLPLVNFILLNPSVADAERSDPTLHRCCHRAKLLGFGGLYITNLYALRSTSPAALRGHHDPVGMDYDRQIEKVVGMCSMVICGWGSHANDGRPGRGEQVAQTLRFLGKKPHVLGLTAAGHPRHPLYLSYADHPPTLWEPTDHAHP